MMVHLAFLIKFCCVTSVCDDFFFDHEKLLVMRKLSSLEKNVHKVPSIAFDCLRSLSIVFIRFRLFFNVSDLLNFLGDMYHIVAREAKGGAAASR